MQLQYFLPQTITVNDSLDGKISGFNFGMTLVGVNLLPFSRHFSLYLGWGFNTGRLLVRANGYRAQKNPFFAPLVSFKPTVYFGRLALGVNAVYQWDISKRGFRPVNISNRSANFLLPTQKQSGLMLQFTLGWVLGGEL